MVGTDIETPLGDAGKVRYYLNPQCPKRSHTTQSQNVQHLKTTSLRKNPIE